MTRDTDGAASGMPSRLAFDSQLRTCDAPLIFLNGIAVFASAAALARERTALRSRIVHAHR